MATAKKKAKKTKAKRRSSPRKASASAQPSRVHLADVSEEDVRQALAIPEKFEYRGKLPLGTTWSLGPVVDHRDATMLAKANYAALLLELERHPEWESQWALTAASHWGTGWLEHLSFEVLDEHDRPTNIFRFLKGWFDALSDDPVADNRLYSKMQDEAYRERLAKDLDDLERRKLKDDLPSNWRSKMTKALRQLEREFDQGDVPYHDDATLEQVAAELGLLVAELAANPEHEPMYMILRGRETATLRGGQLLSLDYQDDGSPIALLLPDHGQEQEWQHQDNGWQCGSKSETFDLLVFVTPDSKRLPNPEIGIGPGAGSWLGFAVGSSAAALMSIILGVGASGALLTHWTLGTLGAAVGGWTGAPEDRRRRGAVGGALGNLVFPILGIGAAVGGWIGGRYPDPLEVQEQRKLRHAERVSGTRASNPTHRKTKNRVLR